MMIESDGGGDGEEQGVAPWHAEDRADVLLHFRVRVARDGEDARRAGVDLADVREHDGVRAFAFGHERDDGEPRFEERERPVLHFVRRVAFGVEVRDLLELERGIEREPVVELAAQEVRVTRDASSVTTP